MLTDSMKGYAPLLSAAVLILCLIAALLAFQTQQFAFIAWYFLAKGIFCSVALYVMIMK